MTDNPTSATEEALRARIAELEAALRLTLDRLDPHTPADFDACDAARAALSRAEPAPPSPPPHLREREVWTAERLEELQRAMPCERFVDVWARLNALPGETIASPEAVEIRWMVERSRGAA